MELKHLRREAMIALDELNVNDCIDCDYYKDCREFCKTGGLSFCDTLMKITGMIDIMSEPGKNNLNK